MPAAGVLAGLIEGAPEGRAEGVSVFQKDGVSVGEEHGAGSVEHGAGSMEREAGNAVATPRDVGTGGAVRTLPTQTPKRIARWMPRRVRQQVAAEQRAAAEAAEGISVGQEDGVSVEQIKQQNRPRQVAVPYQNYRRYRA